VKVSFPFAEEPCHGGVEEARHIFNFDSRLRRVVSFTFETLY